MADKPKKEEQPKSVDSAVLEVLADCPEIPVGMSWDRLKKQQRWLKIMFSSHM